MPQLERRSDRWVSTLQSILLHGVIVGAVLIGWWAFRHRPQPAPTLALDATIVSAKTLSGMETANTKPSPPQASKAPAVPPKVAPLLPAPAPKPQPPPPVQQDDQTVPAPQDLAAREAAAAAEAKVAAQAKAAAERKAQQMAQRKEQAELEAETQARRKAEEEKKVAQAQTAAQAEKRAAEEKRLAEAAEARRKAEAKRKAEEKLLAEQKLEAEQKRKAEEKLKAELARRAAEAKALNLNQSDLSASIAAEEKLMAARSGPAMASWVQQITARIEHAWIRPPSAKPGIDCTIDVTQVPGGQVVNVTVGSCNGDGAVVQSIQNAVYNASPLPPPPDPALFERDLEIEFKPN